MSADALARRCDRKFVDVVLGDVERDGTFSGYASLFGRVDLGKDVVERGAFSNSLLRRKASGIRMLFQHDPNEPIGVWTEIREDQRGLFVRGRLNSDVGRAREVLSLMRSGALDGLSIGFKAIKTRRDVANGVRRIPDFGVVTGAFQITSLEYTGAHDGEVTFEMALESAGPVTFAVTP